jgi:hypothetical protein
MSVPPDHMIEVPCCQFCYDWMRPVMLWAWPVDGVVWLCLNGCGALVQGAWTYIEQDDDYVQSMAQIAARLYVG